MIDREKLAEALGRLEARDREVLDYSLRRKVSDADLGEVFGGSPKDIATLRAAAVERLAAELGVDGGEDLGGLLKELVDQDLWQQVANLARGPGHRPLGAAASTPRLDDDPGPEAVEPVAVDDTPAMPAPKLADAQRAAGRDGPVLDMLTGRGAEAESPRRSRRLVLAALVALVTLVPAGVIAAFTAGSSEGGNTSMASATRPFKPQPEAVGEPFPADPSSAYDYPVAEVTKTTALYDKPDGKVRVRIKPRTDWNSKRIVSVVKRRGDWLAVLVPELKNGQVGWVRDDRVATIGTVGWALHVDLSKRRIEVRHQGRTVRTVKVGVGREDHPTPTGRFAVTDKLRVADPAGPYGCCVLALTGHQTRLPAGWPGGDRLAVHATPDATSVGKAVSLGCMRADGEQARWLMKTVPIGAPVFIHG